MDGMGIGRDYTMENLDARFSVVPPDFFSLSRCAVRTVGTEVARS